MVGTRRGHGTVHWSGGHSRFRHSSRAVRHPIFSPGRWPMWISGCFSQGNCRFSDLRVSFGALEMQAGREFVKVRVVQSMLCRVDLASERVEPESNVGPRLQWWPRCVGVAASPIAQSPTSAQTSSGEILAFVILQLYKLISSDYNGDHGTVGWCFNSFSRLKLSPNLYAALKGEARASTCEGLVSKLQLILTSIEVLMPGPENTQPTWKWRM